MNYRLTSAHQDQLQDLIDIRLAAMRASLEALGRFDPHRAAKRFTDNFDPEITICIVVSDKTVGFYVLVNLDDHLLLDHLYILPEYQGQGIGASVIESIGAFAALSKKPVRLGALRGSKSNNFYLRHGFVKTHETDFDIYYQLTHENAF